MSSYFWTACFKNGTEVRQYDDNGNETMYAVVKQKMADGYEIDSISWLPSTDNGSVFTQYYESWQTPVIARRHFVKQGSQTEDIQYLLGWRATIDDQEHVSVLIIDPKANSIEICNSL